MKFIFYIVFLSNLNSFCQVDCAKVNMDYSGFCFEYYPNGKVKWVKEFQEGQAVGVWMMFDEKGNFLKQASSKEIQDSLLLKNIPKEDDPNQEKHNHESEIIEFCGFGPEAEFPGGSSAMISWINKNLIYPPGSIQRGEKGRVYVEFIVEKDGTISNVWVPKGVSFELNEEAVRLIKSMPKWEPTIYKDTFVRSKMRIPINFELH